MDTDENDDNPPIPLHRNPLGAAWRRLYRLNPKHGRFAKGRISPAPENGQDALDWSVPVKPTADVRMGIDYAAGTFVVFRWHDDGELRDRPWDELYHGYVVEWGGLEQEQRNALIRAGMADHRGRIL